MGQNERSPITHSLKIWPQYYQAVAERRKTYEHRSCRDRDFRVGDTLNLEEWDPDTKAYTGSSLCAGVTYITRGPARGLLEDSCILAIQIKEQHISFSHG